MLFPEKFSTRYAVRKIIIKDIPQAVRLCKGNPLYYQYCPPFVTEDSILDDMNALPPGKTMEDKYYIGFWDGENLIALMDFIDGFPDSSTAFIGFFMTDKSIQHKGIGSSIIEELCQSLTSLGFAHIRLGWVKGNPQSESFWHKNKFIETGVSYSTDGYQVIVAQREL